MGPYAKSEMEAHALAKRSAALLPAKGGGVMPPRSRADSFTARTIELVVVVVLLLLLLLLLVVVVVRW